MTDTTKTQNNSDKPAVPPVLKGLFFIVLIVNIVILIGVAFAATQANLIKPSFKGVYESIQRNYKEPRSWGQLEFYDSSKLDAGVLNITDMQ